MKRIINKIVYTALIAGGLAVSSCTTDDLNPTLAQEKETANAILTVNDMEIILFGAFNRMTSSGYYGRDYIVTNEVRTPNTYSNSNSGRFTTEALFRYLPNSTYIWDNAYQVIASANVVIGTDVEALTGVGGTAPDLARARHIQGQAYAVRALAHFDLVKTYGQEHVGGSLGVPYVTEFLGEDQLPSRATIAENKVSIYNDLETAFDLMSEDFFDSSKETMSKFTAAAIESRVAVYFGDWPRAKEAAQDVVDSGRYSIIPAADYVASFATRSSVNSIFELAFSDTDNNGSNSLSFIYRGGVYGDISVTQEAFNMYEDGDVREDILGTETIRVGTQRRNIGKYPDLESNVPVIRYEEVILNLAEAKFELVEADALDYLNMVPMSRNANLYTEVTKDNILEERREEFIFEGLYYWDLLRTERDIDRSANEGIQEITVPYGDFRLAYPIPFVELDANSNIEQNPGYAEN